ncbi:MAG TPA: hypothetical protein VGQ36_23885 [Thermoanaerobaculia bacterium]|nr:hypothetical protein [Thermoanaerobaculia bacterium]
MTDSIPGLAPSTSPRSDVVPREDLTRRDRDEMFALYTRYFAASDRMLFERDLAEKECVILLRDDDGAVDGFSTLMRMHVGGATVFFSGDTIVARHRWGTYDLPRMWGRHVFSVAGANAYWFLISSGYRTYRYLPVFFRDFYPRDTTMKPLLDSIAATKFGDAYDSRTGVVRLATPAPLREGVSDPEMRMNNPHVRFFVEANPGHAHGDELACLVRIDVENLTPAGLRMIGRR